MKGGYKNQRVCCEAYTRGSVRAGKPVRCKAKGYFTPTKMKYLCMFHGGAKSTDNKTRKYKGLFKNTNVTIENKVKLLKNLINFKNKTDDEIKEYIKQEQARSTTHGYRTKYYTKQLNRWKSSHRRGKTIKDQLENFIRLSGPKS